MFLHKCCLLYLMLYFFAPDAHKKTEEGCFQSIPTISFVDDCPKNLTEWMKAKDRKQCRWIFQNCTRQDRFVYHCLPDRYLEHFIEVCAPTQWIVGSNCPFYNTEKLLIEPNYNHPCKTHSIVCETYYCSSSVYEYQDCYQEMRKKTKHYVHRDNDTDTCNHTVMGDQFVHFLLGALVLCFILHLFCEHSEKLHSKVATIYRYTSGKIYSRIGNTDMEQGAAEANVPHE